MEYEKEFYSWSWYISVDMKFSQLGQDPGWCTIICSDKQWEQLSWENKFLVPVILQRNEPAEGRIYVLFVCTKPLSYSARQDTKLLGAAKEPWATT